MNNTRTGDQSPSSSLRLFLAVPIGEEQRKSVALLSENLKQRLFFGKWTHPADYHLTLKFLGTVDADTAGRMAPVLAEIACRTPPFELELSRLGIFGAPGSPRVLWAGVRGGTGRLEQLQAEIENAVEAFGFLPEARPYRPHLTVARRYQGKSAFRAEALELDLPRDAVRPWIVKEIILYESRLDESPMYRAMERYELGGGQG
ncbi:RNA 2',3'-cyclic phosphodiesterase [Paenibacillus larvae]|uniref:RNA 2',3'-cyclic phosphodiesterase n=1 Tax=Paenibacillus larvae TaxID=1464 RepID=UPI00227FC3C8|nr:RNA 2',3'-cyclic phosphodiesterase [Paenibacillus larvae]MCY9509067.1 RNA 2',3'-cyclic phosphodiesterase [Paenibacillus larvae]MCY9526162.1 RNA 2',3'-cyclic phosphodiesterase [Paenibacillus larvae]